MIKPTSYWALHKTCDPYTLGRVAATLGGQSVEPPLNAAEAALVEVIRQDSEWMDERIEENRERWVKRARARRAKDGAGQDGRQGEPPPLSRDVTQCHGDKVRQGETPPLSRDVTVHPYIHPSVHPSSTLDLDKSKSASTHNARVRADAPELGEVVSAATSTMGVPEWYARWWYEQMVAYDWTTTKGGRIGHGNWRAMLKAWHNRSLGDPKEYERVRSECEARKPRVVEVRAEDWELCAERCARFREGRCAAGKVVPPQMRPRPIPPEECDGFAAGVAPGGAGAAELQGEN